MSAEPPPLLARPVPVFEISTDSSVSLKEMVDKLLKWPSPPVHLLPCFLFFLRSIRVTCPGFAHLGSRMVTVNAGSSARVWRSCFMSKLRQASWIFIGVGNSAHAFSCHHMLIHKRLQRRKR